jgi:hypothetical protein
VKSSRNLALLGVASTLLVSACSDSRGDSEGEAPNVAGSSGSSGAPSNDGNCGGWIIDNTSAIQGHSVSVLGAPAVTETAAGTAVCFNGTSDALVVAANPIEGLAAFTVQLLFRPDAGGATEQRAMHLQEDATTNRALIETRTTAEGDFYLDTFLLYGAAQLTLVTETAVHPTGEFYWVALSYDGETMRHFVRGVEEASGPLAFAALGAGQTSLGARLNQVSWFKGCVRELRCSPEALDATSLEQ